jgi:CRP/FNR family cyclic AMP-dependent transcriptional regulator
MDTKLELLSRVPLFSRCRGNSLEELGRLADQVDVPAGTTLTREGMSGAEFFIIVEGTVRVEREGKVVARLQPGNFFGEIALIDGGPRTATTTAETPAKLLVIAHREFHALLADFPGIRQAVFEAVAQRFRNLEPDAID